MTSELKPDPDVAWLAGITGEIAKGGTRYLHQSTNEKLVRVAGEAIVLRAEIARLREQRGKLIDAMGVYQKRYGVERVARVDASQDDFSGFLRDITEANARILKAHAEGGRKP